MAFLCPYRSMIRWVCHWRHSKYGRSWEWWDKSRCPISRDSCKLDMARVWEMSPSGHRLSWGNRCASWCTIMTTWSHTSMRLYKIQSFEFIKRFPFFLLLPYAQRECMIYRMLFVQKSCFVRIKIYLIGISIRFVDINPFVTGPFCKYVIFNCIQVESRRKFVKLSAISERVACCSRENGAIIRIINDASLKTITYFVIYTFSHEKNLRKIKSEQSLYLNSILLFNSNSSSLGVHRREVQHTVLVRTKVPDNAICSKSLNATHRNRSKQNNRLNPATAENRWMHFSLWIRCSTRLFDKWWYMNGTDCN